MQEATESGKHAPRPRDRSVSAMAGWSGVPEGTAWECDYCGVWASASNGPLTRELKRAHRQICTCTIKPRTSAQSADFATKNPSENHPSGNTKGDV